MNLEGFIEALDRAGCEIDAENLLDIFWLASAGRTLSLLEQTTSEEAGRTVEQPGFVPATPPHETPPPQPDATHAGAPAPAPAPGIGTPPPPAPAPATTTSVYARGSPSAGDRTIKASPFSVPAGRALAHRLPLMRALRPLSQRWPSRQFEELDEERTVDATAQLREVLPDHVSPVFRPVRERWFDAELVLEDDAAIELWADTLREFAQMLRETGAFRLVRSWRLRLAAPAKKPARDQLENAAGARVASVHLSGSGVRRLVIFATHGSSSRWLDGRYARVLEPWVRDGSVLLLQLMPPARWAQTRLGEPHGFAHAPKAGAAAASLEVNMQWWKVDFEPGTKGLLPLPTVPLDDAALGDWARMQMARGRQCPVYLLDPSVKPVREDNAPIELASPRDFERAVAQLRQVSPPAFHLAVSLCTSVFTLPVARLVQSASQGPGGDQSVLAELLQSGLVLARQGQGDEVRSFTSTQYYEFRPLARQILLRSQRDADAQQLARDIQAQVSQYLRQISGSPVSTSQLIPDDNGSYDLPEWAQPFAEVATSLLGGPGDLPSPQQLFSAFERRQPPDIVGAAARLAATRQPLVPDRIDPALWQVMRESRLVQADTDAGWVFVPEVVASLIDLDTRSPLLGARIAWVDDAPKGNKKPAQVLLDWGATIYQALDTAAALRLIPGGRFDAVISDMVRGSDRNAGLDLLARLKETGAYHVPFIVSTGSSSTSRHQEVLDAGAFGFTSQHSRLLELVKLAVRPEAPTVGGPDEDPVFSRLIEALVACGLDRLAIAEVLPRHVDAPEALARALTRWETEQLSASLNVVHAYADASITQILRIINGRAELWSDIEHTHVRPPAFEIDADAGMVGECVRTAKAVWVPDVGTPPNTLSGLGHGRSALVLPVFDPPDSRRVSAVFNIEFDRTDALTRELIDWLSAFVLPSNRLLPPLQRHNFVSFAEADADIVAQLLRELRVNSGLHIETLSSADQLNAHDALIVVYSATSVSPSGEFLPFDLHRLPLWQGILTVIVSGTLSPSPHDQQLNQRIADLRVDRTRGLEQLAAWLEVEEGLASEPQAPPATESPEIPSANTVQVLYATDREDLSKQQPSTYGAQPTVELQFGECLVAIPPAHKLGGIETPSLLKFEIRSNPDKHFEIRDTHPIPEDEFTKVHQLKLRASNRPTLLYVPGFNLSFEGMVLRAAQLSFDLKAQVIVYAWPSAGKVSGYMADLNTTDRVAPKLAALLRRFSVDPYRKTHLWAEGLGANALASALLSPDFQRSSPPFGQLIFTRPDIDFSVFGQAAPLLARTTDRVTAYVSPRDPVTLASSALHKAPRAATVLRAVPGVDTIDISADEGNRGLLADIYQLINQPQAPSQRLGLRAVDSDSGPIWQMDEALSNVTQTDVKLTRPRVFISYVHAYVEHAKDLAEALSPHINVDWDRNLRSGDNWGQELPRLLENADAVVVLVGPLTEKSRGALQEISRAFELKKRLIPVTVDPFQQPAALLRLMFANIDQDGRVNYLASVGPHDMPTVIRVTAKNILKALSVAQ